MMNGRGNQTDAMPHLPAAPIQVCWNRGEGGGARPSQILAGQLTLSQPGHNVSFDWFLSGLEWIVYLEFCY